MERSKQALSLYEDKVQKVLHTRVPTLTDEQHSKVAQVIVDLLTEKSRVKEALSEGDVELANMLFSEKEFEVKHLIIVPDKKLGGMTIFFKQHMNCVAEGNSLSEALQGLASVMHCMAEYQKESVSNDPN